MIQDEFLNLCFLLGTVVINFMVSVLQGNFLVSFMLGWSVTTFSGVIAYPFDTLRRRMMMTSGETAKYSNSFHAFQQIVRNEGISALFRGVTANILLGVAGAGVLALYDQLQLLVLSKSHKSTLNKHKSTLNK